MHYMKGSDDTEKYKQLIKQMLLYGVIGGLSAAVDVLVFTLLLQTGLYELVANIFSVHVGIFISFCLNRRYNFKKTDRIAKRFVSFYLTGLLGLGLSSFILWGGMQLSFSALVTKVFSVLIVAAVQFVINRFITFRE